MLSLTQISMQFAQVARIVQPGEREMDERVIG